METDIALHVQKLMTEEEKKTFLDTFCRNNPHYRGAQVADILSKLTDTDSHIGTVDAMYEAHTEELCGYPYALYQMVCYVAIYTGQGTEWPTIYTLIQRFNHRTA